MENNQQKLALVGENGRTAHAFASGKVSEKYRAIDTEQLVTQALTDLGIGATVRVMGSRNQKSTRHGVVIKLHQSVMLAGTECHPQIYVRNSYAGESSLRVSVGFFRLICSNGMVVGETHFSASVRHVQSGIEKLPWLRNQIVAAIQWITQQMPALSERLNSRILSPEEITRVIEGLDLSERTVSTLRLRTINSAGYLLRREDRSMDANGNWAISAWNLWNIINEEMRQSGRSQLRQLQRNDNLLPTIESVIAA